ncbi:MAG: RluA family pseudouridine synthase [Lentimicrobiaceae bacterium]|nr:RluA family pseudouridine synthase [Lentimicrobiaceae bacterium]
MDICQQKTIMLTEEKDELYEHYKFTVDRGQELMRMDKYLLNLIQNTSRSKIQYAAKEGSILVNGNPEKQNYKVKPGDLITILMPNPPRDIEIIPENIPLEVVYEDEDLIIINKSAGLVVHPAFGNYTGTLVNALTYRFQGQCTKYGEPMRPLLVHRIDKNTSGIMVVAKNEEAQMKIAHAFFEHTIKRKYWALVWGDFEDNEGTIIAKVGRNLKDRLIMTTFPDDSEYGKHAVTHWKVIERFGYVTLIECELETGRTHQIRVHLKSIGHPLFNDEIYGGDQILKGTTFTKYKQFVNNCFELMPRQALHAKQLGLIHPSTEEPLFFDSELPSDFNAVLEKWRKYSQYKGDLLDSIS